MSNKNVKVTLAADVRNYVKGMQEAARSTQELERGAENVDKWGGQWGQSAELIGSQMLVLGAATVAGIGLAVNAYANFDAAMSGVQASTHASAADMELLTQAARDMGASTVFSAVEAAQGIEELAKAGVSTQDILGGGLKGALDLAAAGQISVAEAAEVAASAMTQFKLSGEQVPHIADLLAAGAGKAQGGVRDLAQALAQSGVVASQFGLSIEETIGGLSAFASAGMMGSDAGTSLKTMLQRLSNPAGKAAETMAELGISAWDAQGNFVGLANFAGQLQTSMANLTPEARNAAMSVMFGADAVRAANLLYDQGQAGIEGWIDAVNDAGYAAETAALLQDNLKGDLEKLGGAWDDLLISMGEGANGPLRAMTQGFTGFLDMLGSAPPIVQQTITGLAGVGGALLLAGGAFLTVVPKIAETKAAMETLGITMDALKAKMSAGNLSMGALLSNPTAMLAVVAGLAAVTTAVVLYQQKAAEAERQSIELEASVGSLASGVENLEMAARHVADNGIIPAVNEANVRRTMDQLKDLSGLMDKLIEQDKGFNFGLEADLDTNLNSATGAVRALGDELAKLADTDMSSVASKLADIQKQYDLTGEQMWQFVNESPNLERALQKQALEAGIAVGDLSTLEQQLLLVEWATSEAASGSGEFSDGLTDQERAAKDAAQAVEDLVSSIKALDDLYGGLVGAENAFYQALEDVNAAVEKNGQGLDASTEAGRANRDTLRDLAGATTDLAAELYNNTGSWIESYDAMSEGRQAFIDAAIAMGATGEEAEALADKYGLIPEEVETTIKASTEQAKYEVSDMILQWNNLEARTTVGSDTKPAEGQVVAWKLQTDGTWAVSHMDAEKANADSKVITWKQNADGTWAVAHMGADASAAYSSRDSFVRSTNGSWVQLNVDADVSPALAAIASLSNRSVAVGITARANGGITSYNGMQSFANGGFPTGIYRGGAPLYKFAEPETGWEAFISGRPGQEERNINIALEALKRLGYESREFSYGGAVDHRQMAVSAARSEPRIVYVDRGPVAPERSGPSVYAPITMPRTDPNVVIDRLASRVAAGKR